MSFCNKQVSKLTEAVEDGKERITRLESEEEKRQNVVRDAQETLRRAQVQVRTSPPGVLLGVFGS